MDAKPAEGRIASIDALRGFDMFWIMGADSFFTSVLQLSDAPWAKALRDQLEHTEWHVQRERDPYHTFRPSDPQAFGSNHRSMGLATP